MFGNRKQKEGPEIEGRQPQIKAAGGTEATSSAGLRSILAEYISRLQADHSTYIGALDNSFATLQAANVALLGQCPRKVEVRRQALFLDSISVQMKSLHAAYAAELFRARAELAGYDREAAGLRGSGQQSVVFLRGRAGQIAAELTRLRDLVLTATNDRNAKLGELAAMRTEIETLAAELVDLQQAASSQNVRHVELRIAHSKAEAAVRPALQEALEAASREMGEITRRSREIESKRDRLKVNALQLERRISENLETFSPDPRGSQTVKDLELSITGLCAQATAAEHAYQDARARLIELDGAISFDSEPMPAPPPAVISFDRISSIIGN
jgi:chromosome segregation ATPase